MIEGSGGDLLQIQEHFYTVKRIDRLWGAASSSVHNESSCPMVKRPSSEADPTPSSVKFRNKWGYNSTSSCAFNVYTGTHYLRLFNTINLVQAKINGIPFKYFSSSSNNMHQKNSLEI
jgi:hypothetical protein